MSTSTGELQSLIELQQPNPTRNDVGQEVPNWTTYDTVWAKVHALSARERHIGQQFSSEVDHEITFRLPTPSGVIPNATHRAVGDAGQIYEFSGPVPSVRTGEVTFRATMLNPAPAGAAISAAGDFTNEFTTEFL